MQREVSDGIIAPDYTEEALEVLKTCRLYTSLTATTLRNIIGELELDSTLTSRDTINDKIRIILDEATDAWGIRVKRVELKNILPPREIQDAMEKQMKACLLYTSRCV